MPAKSCPRCEIKLEADNPLVPGKEHCRWCEFELTHTPAEITKARANGDFY